MSMGLWRVGDLVTIRQIPGYERRRGKIVGYRRDRDGDYQYLVEIDEANSTRRACEWLDEFRLDDRP